MFDINLGNITPSNLFRHVGQKDYVLSIIFKPDSELFKSLGSFISAKLVYSKNERTNFENNDDSYIDTYSNGIIKIDIFSNDLSVNDKMKYKLDGIKCTEIHKILFTPYTTNTEPNEEGVKEVPNIINIPYESQSKLEYENMFSGLYSRLINKNEPLLYDEKMEYIGITSAFHDGRTSSKLLSILNVTLEEVQKNSIFWKGYYEAKEKISGLNDTEKQDYEDHKTAIHYKKLKIFLTELLKGGKILDDSAQLNDKMNLILKEIEKFKTTRFGFRSPVIYMNLDSYLHIILRHIPDTKITANNLLKSNIPYRLKDLKMLVEKILSILDDEIVDHYKTKKELKFFRSGERAVYFNGDYFSIDIDIDGRIITFYKN